MALACFFCVGVGVCFQPLVVALVLQNHNVLQENSIPPLAIQNWVILWCICFANFYGFGVKVAFFPFSWIFELFEHLSSNCASTKETVIESLSVLWLRGQSVHVRNERRGCRFIINCARPVKYLILKRKLQGEVKSFLSKIFRRLISLFSNIMNVEQKPRKVLTNPYNSVRCVIPKGDAP